MNIVTLTVNQKQPTAGWCHMWVFMLHWTTNRSWLGQSVFPNASKQTQASVICHCKGVPCVGCHLRHTDRHLDRLDRRTTCNLKVQIGSEADRLKHRQTLRLCERVCLGWFINPDGLRSALLLVSDPISSSTSKDSRLQSLSSYWYQHMGINIHNLTWIKF